MKKVELQIIDLTDQGYGLARTEQGQVVFVPHFVVGDVVKCDLQPYRKSIKIAENVELIKTSSFRQPVPCSYFISEDGHEPACGGCQVQALKYRELNRIKFENLKNKLARIAKVNLKELDLRPIIGMESPWYYRNNVQLKIKYNSSTSSFERGFYAENSHQIIGHKECLISQRTDRNIWQTITEFLKEIPSEIRQAFIDKWHELIIRTGEQTKENLLAFNFSEIDDLLTKADNKKIWSELFNLINDNLPDNYSLTSLWFLDQSDFSNDLHLSGNKYFHEIIAQRKFQIFPRSFFQVNTEQTEVLFKIIHDFALNTLTNKETESRILYDLYCGTGTIGIILADLFAEIRGVELIPDAVTNARENAKLNNIHNAQYYLGRAEHWLLQQAIKPNDLIIVDPPRSGLAQPLIKTLNNTEASSLIYVSCHPGTLARDLKKLKENWTIESIQPVDMFPWTMHVETVVLMSRVDK